MRHNKHFWIFLLTIDIINIFCIKKKYEMWRKCILCHATALQYHIAYYYTELIITRLRWRVNADSSYNINGNLIIISRNIRVIICAYHFSRSLCEFVQHVSRVLTMCHFRNSWIIMFSTKSYIIEIRYSFIYIW